MKNFLNIKKIVTIFILITITIFLLYKNQNSNYKLIDNDVFISENTTDNKFTEKSSELKSYTESKEKIKIHIIGEIKNPGLYELDEGSRINDLIILAGGKTESADLNKVNLAYELADGEQIYIPSIFDETNEYNNTKDSSITNSTTSKKININKATIEDFQSISGIGPSLAQKIISYRNSIGKFNSIEELKNVSGIGEKKFESIKNFISIK